MRSAAVRSIALSLAKGVLDGVEVGTVGREEQQAGACGLDQGAGAGSLVAREVVHHDDVAGAQLEDEHLLDIDLEGIAVDRPGEHEGRDHAAHGQGADKGRRLPVPVREAHAQTLAARAAPVRAGHVGLRPGLVNEHQPLGIEVDLAVEPRLSAFQDVGAVLLCRVAGLFLRVMPCRRKNRCSVP